MERQPAVSARMDGSRSTRSFHFNCVFYEGGGGENLGAWGCSTRDGGNSEDSASSFLQIIINIGVYVSSIVRPSAFGLDLIG